jgi:uncharacterized protein (DUF58 family)
MAVKQRTTICLEGLYYIVVLSFIIGGAILREINLLYVLAGMMIGPLVYNWRIVNLMLKRLQVRRRLPVGVCAGDLLVVEFEATNIGKRGTSSAVIVNDRIERENDGSEIDFGRAEVFFAVIESGESRVQSYQGRLPQRGRYRFGPLHVSTRFPLGLVRRTATIDQVDTLIVCPRPGRLTPQWKRVSQAALAGSGGSRARLGLVEGDYYGLRDWRSGDSRRWIHWRTSARRNKLAVRQFEQPRTQDVILLLELWQPANASDEQRDNVELAISFAATVAEEVCRRGSSHLGIGVAGKEVQWKHGAGSRPMLTEIMEYLAVAQASAEDRLPELLSTTLPEIRRGAMTVIVSTRGVDLHDTERFACVWDDPAQRRALRRFLCIDVSKDELGEFFAVS